MVRLQIVLQSNSAAFLAGEQVNGHVIAQVDQPTKARKVCVEVFGHAYNHWTETHYDRDYDGHSQSHSEDYSAEVQFINVILLLWRPQAAGEGILQPGNYCFPFSFVIPPNALPNHQSRYGSIDYFCKAKVDRPWRVDDEVRFPFLVANIVDLNVVPGAPNAVRAVMSKPVGCCGGGGFLAAEASLAKFGYSSGEQMLLTIDFKNDSSESVTNICVRAHEQWLYRANHCGRQDTRRFTRDLLSFNERFEVPPGQQQRYQRHIQLPALQPTYSCPITVHDFAVSVNVMTSGMCTSSLGGDIPFFVGTVPYGTAQASTPTGNVTVLTQEARNQAIKTVAMDQAVDSSCC